MRIYDLFKQVGQSTPITVGPDITLPDAAKKLRQHNFGALPVLDLRDKLVGILSERDLVRELAESGHQLFNKTVNDIMTKTVITCTFDDHLDDVYNLLNTRKIRHIPIMDGEKLKAMLSIRDFEITYRKLQENSLIDEVTGLPNARYFNILLDKEFQRYTQFKRPFSLAKIKIKGLEAINKSKGYSVGDNLIKNYLDVLNNELATHDSSARLKYDELAIIMPYASYSTACRSLERILTKLQSASSKVGIPEEMCTIAIGVSHTRSELENSRTLITRVDSMLKDAVRSEKSKLSIDPTLQ